MKIPRWTRKCIPTVIRDPIRPIIGRLVGNIDYSRRFYEDDYHTQDYRLQDCTLEVLMKRFKKAGQKARLHEVLDKN